MNQNHSGDEEKHTDESGNFPSDRTDVKKENGGKGKSDSYTGWATLFLVILIVFVIDSFFSYLAITIVLIILAVIAVAVFAAYKYRSKRIREQKIQPTKVDRFFLQISGRFSRDKK